MLIGSPGNPDLKIFPENAVSKLEFDVIVSAIISNCMSGLGRKKTLAATFISNKKQIVQKLVEVKEFQDILQQDLNFPVDNYHDLTELLQMADLPDYAIAPADLHLLNQFIISTGQVISFLKKNKELHPGLFLLVKEVDFKKELTDKLFTIIDLDGNIKSTASDKLFTIRLHIAEIEFEVDKSFEKILKFCKSKDWLTEELESVRNGERVLAFNSKYKRKIKGIIYDESITGKTTFIQPESILDMRNKWFDLKQKEKREVYIILKELTRFIRPYLPCLQDYQELLGYMDHIRAKARYSNYIGASMPLISDESSIKIINGYHPVLLVKNRSNKKNTIPLDLELDKKNRILVISGPNAGGKSVCLKTAGLFQLMVQYGLPVPADENSVIGVFQQLFIDIGDDQSIENELSTYSSRLMNQHYFISHANNKTLFLIDEFGSGTEPATGGMIAEVLLEKLNRLKSRGIVTTHYTNLKVFAGNTSGIMNAAMLFDSNRLQPLYKLKTGEPGSSFALEILKNIGFEKQLIQSISDKLQQEELDMHSLLLDLQDKKERSDRLLSNLQNKESELHKLIEENLNMKSDLKNKKNQIIAKYSEDAESYLQKLIKDFEKLVREWKEAEAIKKNKLSENIRREVRKTRGKISNDLKKVKETESLSESGKISLGDDVILKETGQRGNIIRIKNNKALVMFGNFKTEIELIKLKKVEKSAPKPASPSRSYSSTVYTVKKEAFNPVLDVRGLRRDEAIREVEIYLDKSIFHDFSELKIIHGHGDGILKEAIRSMLKKYSFIKSFRNEHSDHGGDGVTVIEL